MSATYFQMGRMGGWTKRGQANTVKMLTFAESRIVGLGDYCTVLSFFLYA